MCFQCEEKHAYDLKTIDHNVKIYRDKFNCIVKEEVCLRHSNMFYIKYCKLCQLPFCYHCRKHKKHRKQGILSAYKTKRQQHKGTIHKIRSESLYYDGILLDEIKADITTCQMQFSLYQTELLTKANKLKIFIDTVLIGLNLQHRCLKQNRKLHKHIANLHIFQQRFEQSAIMPIKFLLMKTFFRKIINSRPIKHHTSQLFISESLNKEALIESLGKVQIVQKGNRCLGNERLLKIKSSPKILFSLEVKNANGCEHISCVNSDRVWVRTGDNLILKKITGVTLRRLSDLPVNFGEGAHTVNSESELIFIDENYNINRLARNMKIITIFLKGTDSVWRPTCVYSSLLTGDLLVGMKRKNPLVSGKVTRYNLRGELTHTIQHNKKGKEIYNYPRYITENINGDVVVSDLDAVEVTECGGKHRFSYKGHTLGSNIKPREFDPRGLCTDALSHILVCDGMSDTVQMIDKDGQFLSHLLIRPQGIISPLSLSYDTHTHRVWVGSLQKSKICIYSYISRPDFLRGKFDKCMYP